MQFNCGRAPQQGLVEETGRFPPLRDRGLGRRLGRLVRRRRGEEGGRPLRRGVARPRRGRVRGRVRGLLAGAVQRGAAVGGARGDFGRVRARGGDGRVARFVGARGLVGWGVGRHVDRYGLGASVDCLVGWFVALQNPNQISWSYGL